MARSTTKRCGGRWSAPTSKPNARYLRRHPEAPLGPTPAQQEQAFASVIGCHTCHLVNHAPAGDPCRRCGTVLYPRKKESTARTWALVIAALCLYLPANIYPVMTITQLAQTQNFTILAGIKELLDYGLWPLAALVFLASITIPLAKLVTLGFLLIQTQRGRPTQLRGRTRAFRIIDFVGRWSMIDVFMISILVALVRFDQFAQIKASIGAPCFAAVVVLTMFAAITFDPRTMWDAGRSRAAAQAASPVSPVSPVAGPAASGAGAKDAPA